MVSAEDKAHFSKAKKYHVIDSETWEITYQTDILEEAQAWIKAKEQSNIS